jgi:phosphoribosylglycinamide formyltransferase 1
VTRPIPIAVLASGEGTTLDALADEVESGRLPARIVLVIADRPSAAVLEKARRHGLATLVLPARGVDPEAWGARLTSELEARGTELVVLAGFLRILPPSWVEHWKGRAVNVHPALLPKFGGPGMYGSHVHEAVLAAHEPETGVTVHLVTGEVDGGPPLVQERVPVQPGDTPQTLRSRLHPVEVRLLADVIRRFAEGRSGPP